MKNLHSNGLKRHQSIMKRLLLVLTISFLSISTVFGVFWGGLHRDSGKKRAIDDCVVAVNYRFNFVQDTIKRAKVYDNQMLEIGKSTTHYYSLFAEDEDSVMWTARQTPGDRGVPNRKNIPHNGEPIYEDIFRNFAKAGEMTVITRFVYNDYSYTEPIPVIDWQLDMLGQTQQILGYKCAKATAFFRGRHWEAWYAPELPLNYGPWKLGGLPGLILKASDGTQLFSFEAIGITQPQGRKIYKYDIPFIVSSRKNVGKILELRWQDPVGVALTNGLLSVSTMNPNTRVVTDLQPGDMRKPYIPTLELQ